MNKQMKQHLEAVVSALVEQDNTAAKAAFHDYLRLKSQSILIGESDEEKCEKCDCAPCECDDKDDDKKVTKDLDKVDTAVKKTKKDQKKDEDEDCEMS